MKLTSAERIALCVARQLMEEEQNAFLQTLHEAQAQALCMRTRDFERAYRAFVAKETPAFEGD